MNRRIVPSAVAALLMSGAGAAPVHAQWGMVLDWINKLSGPGFVRAGPQFALAHGLADNEGTLRVAAMGGWKVSAEEGSDADGTGMGLFSLQATLEAPLAKLSPSVEVLGVIGIAGHLFTGGDFDNFTTFSFPAQAVLRIGVGRRAALRLGTGFNVFWFPDDAFQPLVVDVSTEGFEGAWGLTAGFEFGR